MFVIIIVAVLVNLVLRPPADGALMSIRSSRCCADDTDTSWRVYLIVIALTFVSAFPLYYTIVMASHTNAEMAAENPPLLPNASLFDNLKLALDLAP